MTRGDYSLTQRAQRGEAATKKGWPRHNAECAEGLERVAEGWIFGGIQNLRKARTFFGIALQRHSAAAPASNAIPPSQLFRQPRMNTNGLSPGEQSAPQRL